MLAGVGKERQIMSQSVQVIITTVNKNGAFAVCLALC